MIVVGEISCKFLVLGKKKILYYDEYMYNETIFKALKNIFIDSISRRKNDLILDKESSLKFVQNKYGITAINQLSDKIKSNINNLIYFDSKIELCDKNKSKKQSKIDSHQAMIDRHHNKCFCNFDLRVLSHYFYLLYEICNEKILYKNVLQNLIAHICNGDYFCFEECSIKILFDYAIDLYLLKGDIYVNNEESKVVRALKYFNLVYEKDYDIKMNRIELSDETNKKIHQIIENRIKKLGSYKTLNILFNELKKKKNNQFNRYLIFRDRKEYGKTDTPLPYQYIIHIASKYLSNYKQNTITYSDIILFNNIKKLSTSYIDLLDIFDENPYAEMTASPDSLPYLIKNNILLESLCFPIQYAPEYILALLQKLYLKIAPKFSNIPEIYTYKSFVSFVKFILNLQSCSIINADIISKNLRINHNSVTKYLNYFSQNCEVINTDYNQAFDKTTLYDKPLLKINESTYFLLCPQFCGYSFLKMLYDDIKRNYNGKNSSNLSKKFGKEFEKFVYNLFDDKNFKYKKGIYAPRTEDKGECDLILEYGDKIVFIEIKNSGIAKEYEYGDDVKVLNQLGTNSLYAQSQILKHKVYLLKNNNTADLYESEQSTVPIYNINTKGKRIYAVSLCGAELLFFTSGFISEHLITILPNVNFSVKDGNNDELNNINSIADEIRLLVNEYATLKSDITLRDIFHLSTVKSVQQLWFIFKESNNIEELIDNLVFETYMQTPSCDFYINFIKNLELKRFENKTKKT